MTAFLKSGNFAPGEFPNLGQISYYLAKLGAQQRALRDYVVTFDYYVDQVNGSDAATGADPSVAWKTLSKVNSSAGAGKKVGLRRGNSWSETFTVPADNMTFGAYGPITGAKPILGVGQSIGITDQKIGTVIQDIQVSGYTDYGFIKQPTAGSAGGAYKRLTIIGPAGGSAPSQGINWAQCVGGVIEDCDISNCYTAAAYPSGLGYGIVVGNLSQAPEIRYNRIADNYVGIGLNGTHRSVNIHHNSVYRSKVNGIDAQGGVLAYQPSVVSNFVYHSPNVTGAAGHGIDSQLATCGPVWRNNLVVSDYTGDATNVELYALGGTLTGADVDYNMGYLMPGATTKWAKLQSTTYTTLAAFQAALVSASVTGAEAHSVSADPLVHNLGGEIAYLDPGSPGLAAGVVLGQAYPLTLNVAPNMGAY